MPLYHVTKSSVRLYETPADAASALFKPHGTELLYGEVFDVDRLEEDWAHGRNLTDGYEGYVDLSALAPLDASPVGVAYMATIPLVPVYEVPDAKSSLHQTVPFGGRLYVEPDTKKDGYVRESSSKGWVHETHIAKAPLSAPQKLDKTDLSRIFETARLFIGSPYIYGGRTARGIDCSALIQLSMARHGIQIPRDSGPQRDFLLSSGLMRDGMADTVHAAPQALDIVFFKGHVGIMADDKTFLHANGYGMQVWLEDINTVIKRYEVQGGQGILAIRRPHP